MKSFVLLFITLFSISLSINAQKLYETFEFKGETNVLDTNSVNEIIRKDIHKRMLHFFSDLSGSELYVSGDSENNIIADFGLGVVLTYNSKGEWVETREGVDNETAQKMQDIAIDMKYEVDAYGNTMGVYLYTNPAGSWYTCWVKKFSEERSIYNGYTLVFSTKFKFIKAIPDKENIE